MGKSNVLSNGLLNLIFSATTLANIAENASSSPITQIYISLHTADPTASGNQASNECTYTGYARVGIARDGSGWTTASGESVSPQAAITFPPGTGGSGTAAFWGLGTDSSGGGELLYSGPISPSIVTGNGVTPQLTSGSTITES